MQARLSGKVVPDPKPLGMAHFSDAKASGSLSLLCAHSSERQAGTMTTQ